MHKPLIFSILFPCFCFAQTPKIADFISVQPSAQTQNLVLPATHTFQLLSQTGTPIVNGALPTNPDFTGFVPINHSSTTGYLSINHETAPGSVTVFDANYNPQNKIWQITNGQSVNFNGLPTSNNCSGAVTPWGTIISGEETVAAVDGNADGWYDNGWLVEMNPATRHIIRKIYKAGHCAHENAAIASDHKTLYTGSDDLTTGYLYKFVSDTADVFNTGKLYVLKLTSGGNGVWVQIPNSTQLQCNNSTAQATLDSAKNISGIEDVEIAADGRVYVASKYSQQVFRFKDNGLTISNYESFVGLHDYAINYGTGTANEPWGWGNDNLCFDNEGNLWVLQDGSRNHIWVVRPNHTAAQPQVELFATTPLGSEPTGITFTPDNKFLFLSLQHPSDTNRLQQMDATGNYITFNKASTIVIARRENLGMTADTSTLKPQNDEWVQLIYSGKAEDGAKLRFFISPEDAGNGITMRTFDSAGKLLTLRTLSPQPASLSIEYSISATMACFVTVEMGAKVKTFKIGK